MSALIVLAQETTLDVGYNAMLVLFAVFLIAATIFWFWMMVDALMKERTPMQKLAWFLVVFLLYFPGALLYLFIRKGALIRPAR